MASAWVSDLTSSCRLFSRFFMYSRASSASLSLVPSSRWRWSSVCGWLMVFCGWGLGSARSLDWGFSGLGGGWESAPDVRCEPPKVRLLARSRSWRPTSARSSACSRSLSRSTSRSSSARLSNGARFALMLSVVCRIIANCDALLIWNPSSTLTGRFSKTCSILT